MKFLANENIPLSSVRYLDKSGFDILSIGIFSPGIDDNAVMDIAMKEDRTIITFDRDYSELIFRYGYMPNAGVIYLRFAEYTPEYPGEIIRQLVNSGEINFRKCLTVIDERGIRQRKY